LQHIECTWECEDDLNDDAQIEKYRARQIRPSEDELKIPPHPSPSDFQVFTEVPYYR
jgi:hypothetical protein